jgi:hypothetical protein
MRNWIEKKAAGSAYKRNPFKCYESSAIVRWN